MNIIKIHCTTGLSVDYVVVMPAMSPSGVLLCGGRFHTPTTSDGVENLCTALHLWGGGVPGDGGQCGMWSGVHTENPGCCCLLEWILTKEKLIDGVCVFSIHLSSSKLWDITLVFWYISLCCTVHCLTVHPCSTNGIERQQPFPVLKKKKEKKLFDVRNLQVIVKKKKTLI